MSAALASASGWLCAYAVASSVLVVVGGWMVGLAYLFVIALTPVLAAGEPGWACRVFGDIDRAKQNGAAKFALPFAVSAVAAACTAVCAVVEQLWISAAGAILFFAAVPALTLVRLVPLTRTMSRLLDARRTDRAACASTVRRWGVANTARFCGGAAGLALVASGTWLSPLGFA